MKSVKRIVVPAAFVLTTSFVVPAIADGTSATGQVAKVNADVGKVTIKHGPIKALDMPDPMTMVYRVKDASALSVLKAGDNVKFDVDHDTFGYIVTHIEKN